MTCEWAKPKCRCVPVCHHELSPDYVDSLAWRLHLSKVRVEMMVGMRCTHQLYVNMDELETVYCGPFDKCRCEGNNWNPGPLQISYWITVWRSL